MGEGRRDVAMTRWGGLSVRRCLARENPMPEEVPVINQTLG